MRQLRHYLVLGIVCLLSGTSLVLPESKNQPPKDQPKPGLVLVDRNGDRLSDSLEEKLLQARPEDLFRVVVTFSGLGNSAMARQQVGEFLVHRDFRLIPGFSATMRAAQILALSRSPQVFRIEEDFTTTIKMDSARRDFGVERAYADYGVSGAGCVICLVDTGASPAHPQLDSKTLLFYDAVNGQTTAYDDNGHGTHVASIAAGDGVGDPQAAQYHGVAPAADIYVAKVLNSQGSGTESQVIAGIEWCAANPAVDIISMSLGSEGASDGLDALSQAVNQAVSSGKILVTAAGNGGDSTYTVGSPAAAADSIAVGAVAEWSAPVGAANHSDGVYLAAFSSRGPTLADIIKPDIAAPGVSIMAANASTNGYVAYSGTSMATPFASGTLALGLEARRRSFPASPLTPLQVKGLLETTATDRGPQGKDVDWGAGLVDVSRFVAEMVGVATSPTPFPQVQRIVSSVPDNGIQTITFQVGQDALTVPIAAAITIDGSLNCSLSFLGICFAWEWSPDLDARLLDPNGIQIAYSGCAGAGSLCGQVGRQETLATMPTIAGTYTLEVWPYAGAPNNGKGASFFVDLSNGPIAGVVPTNTPPSVGISYPQAGQTVSGTVTVQVSASDAEDAQAGSLAVQLAVDGGAWQGTTYNGSTGYYELAWGTISTTNGAHSLQARATDSGGASTLSSAVAVTVANAQALHIGDLDKSTKTTKNNWTANVTVEVHDSNHATIAGATVTGSWAGTPGTVSCVTGRKGRCSISNSRLPKTTLSTVFTVTAASKSGYGYDASANHDPDGDSNGTTITVP
jgi:serine protease AprX